MDLEKRYKDSDGNECTIMQMVLREPEWAANRIQAGEDAIHKLQNISSNSNYAKCADDIMKLFDVDYPDKSVIELTLKKHFA